MSQIQQQNSMKSGAGWPKRAAEQQQQQQQLKVPVSQSLTLNRTINL